MIMNQLAGGPEWVLGGPAPDQEVTGVAAAPAPWTPVTWSPESEPQRSEEPSRARRARHARLQAATQEMMAAAPDVPWAQGGAFREPLKHAMQAMAHLRPW